MNLSRALDLGCNPTGVHSDAKATGRFKQVLPPLSENNHLCR